MKKTIAFLLIVLSFSVAPVRAQIIDLNNIDLMDLIGKVVVVDKGFTPRFFLGKTPIQKVNKVAEILGLKQNEEVNRLFRTFQTGRTIYKVAAYAGGAIVVYSIARKLDRSVRSGDYNAALYSGLGAAASGVIVKMLTNKAAYQAVDIFNGIAVKKIKDIFSVAPATDYPGVAIYIRL